MKQAILITAYKNYEHLIDLINFFDSNFSIYIHIDKKSQITPDQISSLKKKRNVSYVSQQFKVNWGGINHLRAILELSNVALRDKNNIYFHLITGHDYPIKKLDYFHDFVHQNLSVSFMEFHSLPYASWPEGGMDRLSRYNFYDLIDGRAGWGEKIVKRISKLQKKIGLTRKFSRNFPSLYGGSTYWSMNRESIEYVFSYIQTNPSYFDRFKYSFCSEEIFFQTILLNSPLSSQIQNDNLRFIVWEERNGNFPANLDDSDVDQIKSSNALFARKFEYPYSESILKQIQKNLR